jgi:hypothetical protein
MCPQTADFGTACTTGTMGIGAHRPVCTAILGPHNTNQPQRLVRQESVGEHSTPWLAVTRGMEPTSRLVDELLDERLAHRGRAGEDAAVET